MLLLDLLLLIMTVICIVYCWILNQRIRDLQNSRVEFARMIKELNVSIVRASTSVTELSELSKVTNATLKSATETAQKTIDELLILNKVGDDLLNKLSSQISNARHKLQNPKHNIKSNHAPFASINSEEQSRLNFAEEDLADIIYEEPLISLDQVVGDAIDNDGYISQVKKFLGNIKHKVKDGVHLDQMSYYDSLKRISSKK